MKTISSMTPSRQGFTIVEVLVSSFLTLIILGMLFSVLIGTMNAWEGATSKLSANSDSQLTLDLLKSDLTGLVARQTQDNQEWLFSGPYHITSGGDFAWGVGPNSELTNSCIAFFSPAVDRDMNDPGSIVAIMYRTEYMDPLDPLTGNFPIFGLYKSMEDPQVTFDNVFRFPPNNELMGSGGDGYWGSQGSSILDVFPEGFMMQHVVRFSVSWLVRVPGQPDLFRYDELNTVRLSNILKINGASVPGAKIEAAEVTITTISDEGMQRFRFFEGSGNAAGQLSRIVSEFGKTQTLRVPINY